MAVQIDLELNGVVVQGAYVRVRHLYGCKDRGWQCVYAVHNDVAQPQLTELHQAFPYVPNVNIYEQAYTSLKEAYPSAMDC